MRRSRFLAGVAVLVSTAMAVPASAQTVPVSLENPSGSRVVTVETMSGSELTTLDFGKTREVPFRVKVKDTDYARRDFAVSATMTNLYLDNGAGLEFSKVIPSAKVRLNSQVNPVNVVGLTATVQPVVSTVTNLVDSTICKTLGLITALLGNCSLNTTDLTAKVIGGLTLTVDELTDLPNLPIVPQPNAEGAFVDPSYVGAAAADPNKTSTPATELALVTGGTNLTPVLSELDAAVEALPLDAVVNSSDVISALRERFGIAWDRLTDEEVQVVLAAADVVPAPLSIDNLRSLTGTYLSMPTLTVDVPTDAAPGNYKGTMVVTSIQ